MMNARSDPDVVPCGAAMLAALTTLRARKPIRRAR